MIATYSIIRTRFYKYNQLYFDNELPMPKLCVKSTYNFFGLFIYRNNNDGTVRWSKLCVSRYFDFSEKELRDVMVHEMIHYWLLFKKVDMELSHGEAFRKMMSTFNMKYGMNIKIKENITLYKRVKNAPLLPWIVMMIIGYLDVRRL